MSCEECLDNALTSGTFEVEADPACVGDTITFTVSGVIDEGAIKRVDCYAKTGVDPGTISYTWIITKPDGSTVDGSGDVATAFADIPGNYSVIFTAKTDRECQPDDWQVGPATAEAATVNTLEWEPLPGNNALDPDLNNGGKRIFPGKQTPNDAAAAQRRQVKVKATINPVVQGGCMVYFHAWDVDDPFDQLYGCPGPTPDGRPCVPGVAVVDGNTASPDNRGGPCGQGRRQRSGRSSTQRFAENSTKRVLVNSTRSARRPSPWPCSPLPNAWSSRMHASPSWKDGPAARRHRRPHHRHGAGLREAQRQETAQDALKTHLTTGQLSPLPDENITDG